jgi:hypothetical protein
MRHNDSESSYSSSASKPLSCGSYNTSIPQNFVGGFRDPNAMFRQRDESMIDYFRINLWQEWHIDGE